MLAEVIATSFQQRWQTKSKNGKTLEDIINLIYIHNTNPKNTSFTLWNRLMSFVLKIVKNLIEEYPCQNKKQLEKKEGGHIENDKNGLNRCIAGRTWMEDCGGTGEHHLQQ